MLFGNEEQCWKCGAVQPEVAAAPEPEAPAPEPAAREPTRPARPAPAPAPTPQAAPRLAQPEPVSEADQKARTLAIWALVLSIIGWFTCCLPLSPIGLWLAVKARRERADGLATVALVFGIIGTVFAVLATAFAVIVFVDAWTASPSP